MIERDEVTITVSGLATPGLLRRLVHDTMQSTEWDIDWHAWRERKTGAMPPYVQGIPRTFVVPLIRRIRLESGIEEERGRGEDWGV